jgi:hypothetical protein
VPASCGIPDGLPFLTSIVDWLTASNWGLEISSKDMKEDDFVLDALSVSLPGKSVEDVLLLLSIGVILADVLGFVSPCLRKGGFGREMGVEFLIGAIGSSVFSGV